MVSMEERLTKTGTPSLASASLRGHYNPDVVFLSSEPTIKVSTTITSRASPHSSRSTSDFTTRIYPPPQYRT